MCKECFLCLQTSINCFNTVESVRNDQAALRTDHAYLQNNSPRLSLIILEVQKKVSNRVATDPEREWLRTAKDVEAAAVSILGELGRILKDDGRCLFWYLICWCNLGRRTSVIRQQLQNRLEVPCAQEIEKSIPMSYLQMQTEPVIQQLGAEQTVFATNRSFDEFWTEFRKTNVQVIGIHGMIGIGKSTFLKRINDDFNPDRRGFDKVIFVPQSLDPNIDEARRIQDEIAKRLGITTLPEDSVIRCTTLSAILSSMNVILLLDHLLHGGPLSSLGIPIPSPTPAPTPAPAPLPAADPTATPAPPPAAYPTAAPDNQHKICKVVFTARKKLMGSNIGAPVHEIELDLLSKDDSRKLLKSKVWAHNPNSEAIRTKQFTGEYGKTTKTIEDVADKIADMCGGLPLALDKIGEHLQTLTETGEWRTALGRLCKPEQASDADPECIVYDRLKEAYNSLTDGEKKCFLYCSLFPKGHAIDENELKRHWTVEEYLGEVTGNWALDAYYDSATTVIEKLKRAHLLRSNSDSQSYVEMHSQFHCMARWIEKDKIGKENFGLSNENLDELSSMSPERRQQVKRIFFIRRSGGSLAKLDCPNLSTFVIRNSLVSKIEPDLFDSVVGSVKVLDLANCTLPIFQLNDAKMTDLQYLNLSRTNIESFPFDFKNLSKLKFLDLSFMERLIVTSLKDLSTLTDLRVLNFYYCGPCGQSEVGSTLLLLEEVEKLDRLGDLAVTISGDLAFQKLKKFSKLNLMHSMVITNCGDTSLKLKYIATAKKLKMLLVIHCSALLDLPQNAISPEQCFVNLCNIEITDCWNLEDLTWLKYARALQLLKIAKCPKLTEVIDSGLPGGTQADPLLFDKLRNLELIDLQLLSRIYFDDLPFSSLESIKVHECDNLDKFPIAENNGRKTKPIIECQKGWWEKMGNDPRKSRLLPVFRPRS